MNIVNCQLLIVDIFYLIHGLDAAQGDILLPQQLVGSLLAGRSVQLEGEAEGGDKEAASVARGHPTHPERAKALALASALA